MGAHLDWAVYTVVVVGGPSGDTDDLSLLHGLVARPVASDVGDDQFDRIAVSDREQVLGRTNESATRSRACRGRTLAAELLVVAGPRRLERVRGLSRAGCGEVVRLGAVVGEVVKLPGPSLSATIFQSPTRRPRLPMCLKKRKSRSIGTSFANAGHEAPAGQRRPRLAVPGRRARTCRPAPAASARCRSRWPGCGAARRGPRCRRASGRSTASRCRLRGPTTCAGGTACWTTVDQPGPRQRKLRAEPGGAARVVAVAADDLLGAGAVVGGEEDQRVVEVARSP